MQGMCLRRFVASRSEGRRRSCSKRCGRGSLIHWTSRRCESCCENRYEGLGQPRENVFAGKKFGDVVTGDQISKAAQQAVLVAEEGHIDKKQNLVCHLCIRVTSPKANSSEKKSKDWIVEVIVVFENAPSVFIRTNSLFLMNSHRLVNKLRRKQ